MFTTYRYVIIERNYITSNYMTLNRKILIPPTSKSAYSFLNLFCLHTPEPARRERVFAFQLLLENSTEPYNGGL